MGVCCVCYAISDTNLTLVLADPPLVWRIVDADDDAAYLRELQKFARPSLLSRLLGKAQAAPQPRELSFGDGEMQAADLDKSWDGLKACLKICVPEVPCFFDGSGQVGDIEVGYGPALFHMSDTMARIAQAYAGLTESDVLAAYDEVNLEDLYPRGLWQRPDDQVAKYLTETFTDLKAFVQHVGDRSLGALIQYT